MKRQRLFFIIGLIIINAAVLVAAVSFLPPPDDAMWSGALFSKLFATTQWGLVFKCVLVSGLVSAGVYCIVEAFQRAGPGDD